MTDAETIAALRAELARVKEERDAWRAQLKEMGAALENNATVECQRCAEGLPMSRIIDMEELCADCEREREEEAKP